MYSKIAITGAAGERQHRARPMFASDLAPAGMSDIVQRRKGD